MSIGHKSLVFAAKVIATSALDLLTQPETLRVAQEELKERLGGRTYKTPVPPEAKPPLDQWTEKP
jgi:aminobenzoyl-glutamate utilization protein B